MEYDDLFYAEIIFNKTTASSHGQAPYFIISQQYTTASCRCLNAMSWILSLPLSSSIRDDCCSL